MVPRGALKRKKPSGGKKAATLGRLVDTFDEKNADQASRAKLAQEQDEWTKEYQAHGLELAQRKVF